MEFNDCNDIVEGQHVKLGQYYRYRHSGWIPSSRISLHKSFRPSFPLISKSLFGAIQVLRNAVGEGVSAFPEKTLRRCKVQLY